MPRRLTTRPGFTLVEQLVAITVLGVGLLALAGTGALLQRHAREALGRGTAAARAAARLEWLAARPCGTLADGSGHGERWTVHGAGPMRAVAYEIARGAADGAAVWRFEGAVPCAP